MPSPKPKWSEGSNSMRQQQRAAGLSDVVEQIDEYEREAASGDQQDGVPPPGGEQANGERHGEEHTCGFASEKAEAQQRAAQRVPPQRTTAVGRHERGQSGCK